MYSDGESDPLTLGGLITEAQRHPASIVSASRWLRQGSFHAYPAWKLVANYLFQRLFACVYRRVVTDFTFGYRLYPQAVLKSMAFEEVGHAFVFESIVKPIRLGVEVREIPATWRKRSGVSQLAQVLLPMSGRRRQGAVGATIRISEERSSRDGISDSRIFHGSSYHRLTLHQLRLGAVAGAELHAGGSGVASDAVREPPRCSRDPRRPILKSSGRGCPHRRGADARKHAARFGGQLDELAQEFCGLRAGDTGAVRIGASSALGNYLLPALVAGTSRRTRAWRCRCASTTAAVVIGCSEQSTSGSSARRLRHARRDAVLRG
jgi:hypothetical protein